MMTMNPTTGWFSYVPHKEPNLLNPLVLAYIGDAVYEVFVRQYLLSLPNHRPHELQKRSTRYVSAKAQSTALESWFPILSEEELGMLKRGRNAKSGSTPKNADIVDYRRSTGFECLLGYLYLSDRQERMTELMELAIASLNERNAK